MPVGAALHQPRQGVAGLGGQRGQLVDRRDAVDEAERRLVDEGDPPRRAVGQLNHPCHVRLCTTRRLRRRHSVTWNSASFASLTVRPSPGVASSEIDVAVDRLRLAVEDVPEQLVADLDVDDGEVLRDRRVQAGHHHVIVVHLPGMRHDRHLVGLGQRRDLAGLRDAADAVGVELDDVERARLEQVAELVQREGVLAAGDGDAAVALEGGVALQVVRNHRLFEPAQVERLEQRQHPLGVVERPAHVGVGHDVDAGADRLAHGAHQIEVALHAFGAVDRAPAEAQLHGAVAGVLVAARFRRELVERRAVQAAGVDRNAPLGPAAEQAVDRLAGGLAEHVPERDVDRADRDHAEALAAPGHGLAVHVLPEELDVPRILADEQRRQVAIDDRLGHVRRQRGVADADVAAVGEHLDDQPAVERERRHRGLRPVDQVLRQQVHRVRAEVRGQRDGLAAPLDDAGANTRDLHAGLGTGAASGMATGRTTGMARQMTAKARTCSEPAMAKTTP